MLVVETWLAELAAGGGRRSRAGWPGRWQQIWEGEAGAGWRDGDCERLLES